MFSSSANIISAASNLGLTLSFIHLAPQLLSPTLLLIASPRVGSGYSVNWASSSPIHAYLRYSSPYLVYFSCAYFNLMRMQVGTAKKICLSPILINYQLNGLEALMRVRENEKE